jgi:anaerobic selenocysteine-containing dehydrogenase
MIHVIINEGLHDKTFIEQWTVGFDELRAIGFLTPSGKVELYSNQLKEWGFDPLPLETSTS